jgi:hypothetical protein
MFATHMEEASKDKVAIVEDHPVLRNFEVFLEKFHDFHQRETLISLLIWCHKLPQCLRPLTEWAHQN